MTTKIELPAIIHRLAPRGSLIRYGLAGGFNSSIFFISWSISMLLLPDVNIGILWGVFWGLTGVLAHFVHRWFTFDNHKSVSWTLPTAIPVYVISLLGSSFTIDFLSASFPQQVYWLGIVNLLGWGVLIWFTMRTLVFQFSSATTHASLESPKE